MAQREFRVEGLKVTKLPSSFDTAVTVNGATTLNDTTITAGKTLTGKVSASLDSVKATNTGTKTASDLMNRDEVTATASGDLTYTGTKTVSSGKIIFNGTGVASFQKGASREHQIYADDVGNGRLLFGYPGAPDTEIVKFRDGGVTAKNFHSYADWNGTFSDMLKSDQAAPIRLMVNTATNGSTHRPYISMNYTHYDQNGTNGWSGLYNIGITNTNMSSGSGTGNLLLGHRSNNGADLFALEISPRSKMVYISNGDGNVASDSIFQAGKVFATGGNIQSQSASNAMFEMHVPGKYARALYLNGTNGSTYFATTNGNGSAADIHLAIGSTGQFVVYGSTGGLQAWHTANNSPFQAGPRSIANGGLTSAYEYANQLTGQWTLNTKLGYYVDSGLADTSGPTLTTTDGGGYVKSYQFRNDGALVYRNLVAADGGARNWIIDNGDISSSRYGAGNSNSLIIWCVNSFAPKSDIRLKTNITPTATRALDSISKMQFKDYDWKNGKGHVTCGVVAQDLEVINSQFVDDFVDASCQETVKTLNTANLLSLALKAIQELQAEVNALKAK